MSTKDKEMQKVLDSVIKVLMDEPEMEKLMSDVDVEIMLYGAISDEKMDGMVKEAFKKLK